jgi:CheY-like chemotaxis protein
MLKILLIEDNLVDQMAFFRMMEKQGLDYKPDVADNISKAEKLLNQKEYQLVVCDLNLPDGTAFDLSAFFKKNTFVLLSGHVDAELKEKAKQAGIEKVVSKTSDLVQFSNIIEIINNMTGAEILDKKSNRPIEKYDPPAPMLAHLKKAFDNNSAYIADIIQAYLKENPKLISRLSLAAEIDDKQQIVKTAHQLKSGYMMMGLKELEHLAVELESNFLLKNEECNDRIQEIIDRSNQSYLSLNNVLIELENPT